MLVTDSLKYILFDKGANREQLFDRKNDPGELLPVTENPEYLEQLIACRQMLKEWVLETDDDFNVDNIVSEYKAEASLIGIAVNNHPVENFHPAIKEYTLDLVYTDIVLVEATPVNSASVVTVTQLDTSAVEILVASADGTDSARYKLILDIAEYIPPESNASLTDITINGVAIAGFYPAITHYEVLVDNCSPVVVDAIPSYSEATVLVLQPSDIHGETQERTALIQVISKDGSTSSGYSVTVNPDDNTCETGIKENNNDNIAVFPNPASDFITVNFNDGSGRDLIIYNIEGQIILSKQLTGANEKVFIGHLGNGFYVMQIKSEFGIYTSRLIKTK